MVEQKGVAEKGGIMSVQSSSSVHGYYQGLHKELNDF